MTRVTYIICGAAVLFGSFFITLWITEPENAVTSHIAAGDQSDSKGFEAQRVSNYSDLPTAAQNVGLRISGQMKGNIDAISRISERAVNISGWLADPQGNSTPLNLLVFIDGSMVAAAQTKGERPDVADAFHLGFGAEKNVAFSLNFNCRSGDLPVVVGISQAKQYIPLESKKCP